MEEFKFPDELTNYERVKNKEELSFKLRESANQIKLRNKYFRILSPTPLHLYAKCTKCLCSLKYRWDEDN